MIWLWQEGEEQFRIVIHLSDIVSMIFSMDYNSTAPDGHGTEESPYAMSTVSQWYGAATARNPSGYTWYRIGGRLIRRDFAKDYLDYMLDVSYIHKVAPSYPAIVGDILINARTFQPTETAFSYYSAKLVARQIRSLLQGHQDLRIMNWPGVSVLVATLFIAEQSRNRSTFTITMMLLDLVQKDWVFDYYGLPDWDTILWKDALHATDMYNLTLGKLSAAGGLHPMARNSSVQQSSEGIFNPKHLTLVRQMEAVIALNWLKEKFPDEIELVEDGVSLEKLHHFRAAETNENDLNKWKTKLAENKGLKPLQFEKVIRQKVLNEKILPLLKKRSKSFKFSLEN